MFKEYENHLIVEEFEKMGVIAIFSKKDAGNMSYYTENNKENNITGLTQIENKLALLKEYNLQNKNIIQAYQKHTNIVLDIKENDTDFTFDNVDGFITKRRDVVLVTYYADCLPISIYDKKQKVIGVAHSGWQGSYKEIIKSLINKMKECYNTKVSDLHVALGVGISSKNYEVSKDFYLDFLNKFGIEIVSKVFHLNEETSKYHFDNTKLNYIFCKSMGIENIIVSEKDVFDVNAHSYRRDKKESGRSSLMISFKD